MEVRSEIVDLDEVIRTTMELLEQTAVQKQIKLVNRAEPGLKLFVDKNMLFTVLRNLVANGLKFTQAAGTVSITARGVYSANNTPEPTHVEISVIDTGVGIATVDQEKLFQFDSHFTTPGTSQEHGAGLGLILCKEMVERNGGSIWMQSEQGKGTVVSFSLPLVEGDSLAI